MSSTKRGKAALVEFENQTKEIRQMLNEQLKSFDARTEGKVWFLADLQEYYKRMSEVEMEYSKTLEKLSERFLDRLQKFKAQRKERSTTIDLWHRVLLDTKNRAKLRQTFSENLANNIANRFTIMSDDYQRIYKKCREAGLILQDELLSKSVHELQRRLRKYHTMYGESKASEVKLKSTAHALMKSEESGRKNDKMARQKEKHQQRFSENKKKSIKAKNEYVMSLQGTNKFVQVYFNKYLADLLDGFDFKYHDSFKRAVEAYTTAEATTATSTIHSMDTVREVMLTVSAELDKQYFFEDNQSVFALPYKFQYLPYSEEESCQISPQQTDIVDFHCDLFERLKQIKAETDEIQKSAEATTEALREMYRQWDNEMIKMANGESDVVTGLTNCQSIKNSSDDLELYYVTKFREILLTSSLKIRMEAENNILTRTLGEVTEAKVGKRRATHRQLPVDTKSPQATAILQSIQRKTKIFGCNMVEYLKITGRQVPEVVESCVRFIKKFGLEHPGIFRLSGSSTDINDMKQLFECGRDPLAGLNHWKDINAVAGLLRVYFRELEDALFSRSHYQQFIMASKFQTSEEGLREVTTVINDLPDSIIYVMKYLFTFLKQVSEHSELNKMDSHNLAVIFGPTLLHIPTEQDMIAYQSHVNGMMELIIRHCYQIFPGDIDTDAPRLSETEDSDSEEDFEPRDAEALFDYSARSSKELSFKKGDIIRVFKRFNDDWWDGTLGDTNGFVPASYIRVNDADVTDGDGCFSPQSEGLPKSSPVISPGDTLRNGPPRIPKREGSLKKRHGSTGADRGSPLGPCPQPPIGEVRSFSQPSMAMGKPGFRPAISTDDIISRQRSLKSREKDDMAVEVKTDPKIDEESPKCSTLPRSSGTSPDMSTEDFTKVVEEEEGKGEKEEEKSEMGDIGRETPKRSQSIEMDKPEEQRPIDDPKSPVWQIREDSTPIAGKYPDPPISPRSSQVPKVPPAVKPKPKGGRPNPPTRVESGNDLLASLHAAQAARSHRPLSGEKGDETRRDSRGSSSDDTQL